MDLLCFSLIGRELHLPTGQGVDKEFSTVWVLGKVEEGMMGPRKET